MSPSFVLKAPDHFTAGAVGPPGQRVFYLQAQEARTLVTLTCEKEHVSGLGEYLAGLLAQRPAGSPAPPGSPAPSGDLSLREPLSPSWRVGTIGVGYDEAHDRIVVEATEAVDPDEGATPTPPATARFHLTRAQTAAFVERSQALVKAGRPICPMCGQPRDPGGHACPRSNGHAGRRV
jgi:uncharacterized repeat protein (TIGR03847 family)